MNWKNWLVSIASAGLLAACGGGGSDAGESPFNPGEGNGGGGGDTSATSLIVNLSKTSVTNTDATPVGVTVTAVNSAGVVVPGAAIGFDVVGGSLIRGAEETDSSGKLTATVDFSADKSNRVVTVKVTSGSVSETRSFSVTGVKVSATALPAIIAPTGSGTLDVVVSDAANAPIGGLTVTATSAASGSPTNLTETTPGTYRYSYTVPASFAQAQFPITVTAAGVTQTQNVPVQQGGSVAIPDAEGTIGSAVLTIDPSVIPSNDAGSTANQGTVRLKVFDVGGNPMSNVRVSFDQNASTPSRGAFSTGSSVIYTDADGVATTSFIPGSGTTGANGLVLRACFDAADFSPNLTGMALSGTSACPRSETQTATITKDAFNVVIGSNDEIEETSDGLRYVVKYVVQVVNASGQAKANVQITPTLDLLGFEKGTWVKNVSGREKNLTLPFGTEYPDLDNDTLFYSGCRNEDLDRNGVNALFPTEDFDNDKLLEPRKSDAAISFINPSQTKTDETGAVGLQVTYLKNVASWLRIKIYVTGAVSGTEGKGTFTEVLPVPISAVNGPGTPAFAISPYGVKPSCDQH